MRYHLLLAAFLASASSAFAQDCSPDAVRKEVTARATRDQDARKALLASPRARELNDQVLRIDAENTAFMRTLLAKCGWPGQSVVGEDAATAAWLMTQHADMDPAYQVMAAQQMKYAVLSKEASPMRLALLVDRNRRLTNQPQVYGMQYYAGPDKTIHFLDIVTPGQLEARRAEIGLVPFYCHALQISKENGNAPIEWPAGVLFTPSECATSP